MSNGYVAGVFLAVAVMAAGLGLVALSVALRFCAIRGREVPRG